jgi:2-amino-4-hydroxy-6-hydroxymethyldihydropteridine diphosphokinase
VSQPADRRARVRAFVALGSNLGDRRALLEDAVERLGALSGSRVVRASPWIETAAVGGPPGQPSYLNGVVELETELAPRELLEQLLALERRAGRVRGEPNAPRTLDLDLLLYGDVDAREPGLVVPHPRMEEREFVLEPLAHIAPSLRLPRSRRTVSQRLAELRAAHGRS